MTADPITDLATAVEVMGALPMPAGPATATPRWRQARTELIRTFRDYMPETAATKATDSLDEVIAEALLEGERKRPTRADITADDPARCLKAHTFSPRDGWRMVCDSCDHGKDAECHNGAEAGR